MVGMSPHLAALHATSLLHQQSLAIIAAMIQLKCGLQNCLLLNLLERRTMSG
jgi:hypothetical protein